MRTLIKITFYLMFFPLILLWYIIKGLLGGIAVCCGWSALKGLFK